MKLTGSVEIPADDLIALVRDIVREERAKESAPRWLSDLTAAAYTSTSKSTVARWRAEGLPHRFVGGLVRIDARELDAWIESHPGRGQATP